VIHRGQGYLYGNVSHLVMLGLWTNTPQDITVLVELLNANTSQVINSKTVQISLMEGFQYQMVWIPVNASEGMFVQAHAKIISYQNDTDLRNNELYSNTVFLKPFLDLHVFVIYKPVRLKIPTAVLPDDIIEIDIGLPDDIIEIDIGIKTNIPLKLKPMSLRYWVHQMNLKEMKLEPLRGADENISTTEAGIIWRNLTVTVPWPGLAA